MNEQETYQTLKQILPQLQFKLRHNIEQEYQEQLEKMQEYYNKSAQDMLRQKQMQIRREVERNQTELRKQLSLIQKQRQQWLLLEQSYRKTIFQLTSKLKQGKSSNDLSALTEILPYNPTQMNNKEVQTSTWKKKNKFQTVHNKNNRTDSQNSYINSNIINSVSKFSKQLANSNAKKQEQLLIEDMPLKIDESNKKKWKISQKSQRNYYNLDVQARGKRQDTLVLSPPKIQEMRQMKSSVLQPPQQQHQNVQSTKSSIFWNEEGKKKLLSMIRNIK